MEYNKEKIAQRIKEERIASGFTQQGLADAIFRERQLVIKWEKGTSLPSLEDMMNLCRIFGCELGYLLCEFDDCKTRDEQFCHDFLGISPDSISRLIEWKNSPQKSKNLYGLDVLLKCVNFDNALGQVKGYEKATQAYSFLQKRYNQEVEKAGKEYATNITLHESLTREIEKFTLAEYRIDRDLRFVIQEIYNKNRE